MTKVAVLFLGLSFSIFTVSATHYGLSYPPDTLTLEEMTGIRGLAPCSTCDFGVCGSGQNGCPSSPCSGNLCQDYCRNWNRNWVKCVPSSEPSDYCQDTDPFGDDWCPPFACQGGDFVDFTNAKCLNMPILCACVGEIEVIEDGC